MKLMTKCLLGLQGPYGDIGKEEPKEAQIQMEPWKVDVLALEKKASGIQSRASRAIQTGNTLVLKLTKVVTQEKTDMSKLQLQQLEKGINVLTGALKKFTEDFSGVNSKSEKAAEVQALTIKPAIKVLTEHCASFDKLISCARQFLTMFEV